MKTLTLSLVVSLLLLTLFAAQSHGSWGVVEGSYLGGSGSGLIASYPFNGNANDESGNGNHGQVNGASLSDDRDGLANSAYSFDGQSGYIEVANTNGDLSLSGAFTISAWVYPSSGTTVPILEKVAESGGNDDNYHLWYLGGSGRFDFNIEEASGDDDFSIASSDNFPPNAWYSVVVTYDGADLTLYVNGVEENRITIGSVVPYTGSESLRIGNSQNTNHDDRGVFSGHIDDIRIYGRGLSGSEVADLFTYSSATGTDSDSDTTGGSTDGTGGDTTSGQSSDFDAGYQQGMEYCRNNPSACGISTSQCSASSTTGTVSPNLEIYAPSLDYESLLGTINIHATFEYEGVDSSGKHTWSLRDYGSN